MQGSDNTSCTATSTPGWRARNCASTPGSQPAAKEGSRATATCPRANWAVSRMALAQSSSSSAIRWADSQKRSPSCVSSTWRVLRSNSFRPTWSSSALISALNAGCDRWQRAAARVKFFTSARARKAWMSRAEIFI